MSDVPIDGTRSRLLIAVPAVLLVAALIAVAVLGYRTQQARQIDEARSQAMAAARVAAADILSYDHRHLDRDFARAKRHLTGKFADDYAKTTQTVVRPTAKRLHAVVTAEVRGVSTVTAARDRVVVLLFVNQKTTSDARKARGEPDRNRVRMTLDRADDRWLVSDVDGL